MASVGLRARRVVSAAAALAVGVAIGGAGAAVAGSAPSVTTGPVTAVGPLTATVSGSVNPNGLSTSWYVEYGATTSYGSKTSPTSAGSGVSSVAVSANLSGLQPGTTYHYRFVATSSAGTGTGMDGLLTTTAAPQVVTGNATAVTTVSATVNGTVNPNGRATSWYFDYGTSTGYGSKTASVSAGLGTSPVNVQASLTGLSAGRTYHFRLVATSDAGTSNGSDQTFVTAAAPSVTTNPASQVGDGTARLNGTVNPNGAGTTWYFEYGASTSYGTKTPIQSAGAGTNAVTVSTSVSGLNRGAPYHFRLVATNASGTTVGGDQSFTTSGPPVVHTGAAAGVGMTNATMTGAVDASGHSTSWYFEYGTSTGYGARTSTSSAGSSTGSQPVSSTVSNLHPGTTYHYRLVASNQAGTVSGDDATFTTSAPTVTLVATRSMVVFGSEATLSGTVSSGQVDRTVALFAQRLDHGSFLAAATALTRQGGSWSITVRPAIGTVYKALCDGGISSTITINVRPAITVRPLPRQRFQTHVSGERSFAGRTVQLQRLLGGRWVTIARAALDARGTAIFRPRLRRGSHTLRVAMSVNQAGNGYLAGYSPTLHYRIR